MGRLATLTAAFVATTQPNMALAGEGVPEEAKETAAPAADISTECRALAEVTQALKAHVGMELPPFTSTHVPADHETRNMRTINAAKPNLMMIQDINDGCAYQNEVWLNMLTPDRTELDVHAHLPLGEPRATNPEAWRVDTLEVAPLGSRPAECDNNAAVDERCECPNELYAGFSDALHAVLTD
ncbi:hypothetical protein HOD30_02840 [Candidatus Peregrinibacteria bacterium]|jgi:hypothetical protein|nr:hypothetical protein [Candidatus Peregrinibacteria bacterium]MBT4631518.1 hypothetical protein [Candidatus Peregrinibacteria bacterium]MBT5516987.1 hypothetical protein [Candidatus Peregrinibacteria bacterium]